MSMTQGKRRHELLRDANNNETTESLIFIFTPTLHPKHCSVSFRSVPQIIVSPEKLLVYTSISLTI